LKRISQTLVTMILALLVIGCTAQSAATQTVTKAAVLSPTAVPAEPAELIVFAAASLNAAFGEIGIQFEAAHPGVTVVSNFAGSQQLSQQITEGAPSDVFASANKKQMEVVIAAGEVVSGTQQTFAKNRLVVIYPQDNPAGLTNIKDLSNPGLKLVLAAKEVPVGQYTLDFLDKAESDPAFQATFKDDVLKTVVSYEDNVKAVLTKVALGEADAGIVYTSDVTGEDAEKVSQLAIPDALNVIASYPIAPIKDSKNLELAKAYIEMVLSQKGQDILAKYGFISVK
jgi:molybdate transport system substrate-binding protein